MSLINDVKRDREAGTPGPWATERWDITAHGGDWTVCDLQQRDGRKVDEDLRRIARVPDLEAALLACHEALRKIANEPVIDTTAEIVRVDRLATDALDILEATK